MAIICKYKFNSTLCADYLPEFNTEFTGYTKTDVDNGDNTITRTIEHDTLKPTLIRFGKAWVGGGNNEPDDRTNSLLEMNYCDISNINNMNYMFYNCNKLTSLDLSNFDTINVTNMVSMFNNCSSLTSLDLSSFDTSNVTNMNYMFYNCTSLTSLDVSNFNTSKVNNMRDMFYKTLQLQDIGMVYCNKATIDKVSSLIQHTANIYVNSVIPDDCTPVDGITFIFDGDIKTLYLNSPLLEGDTIEEKEDGIYHVHRGEKVVFDGSENWENTGFGNNETLNSFYFSDTGGIPNVNTAICDKMMVKNMWDSLEEGIWIDESCVITISKSKATNIEEFKTYLSNNPITAVYQLETPTYELIEQSNLTIPSYANGHLDLTSAVPVEKVQFKPFSEELIYLYPATSYTLQFESDKAIAVDITLGGTELLAQSIVAGLNRISITTPTTLTDNKLIINGVGANISEVVVTDTNRKFKYFEGMKSVGECEELEVVSRNKNLWDTEKVKRQDGKELFYTKNNNIITYSEIGKYGIYIPIKAKKNETLRISGTVANVQNIRIFNSAKFTGMGIYNKDYRGIETEISDYICIFPEDGEYYIRVWVKGTGTATLTNFLVEISSANTTYVEHQSNSQQLTHEPLRAVGDVKDRYVLIDGKWYIERNCKEDIVDGTEEYWTPAETSESHSKFYIYKYGIRNKAVSGVFMLSDRFTWGKHTTMPTYEYIRIGDNLDISISNSKLSTQDVSGFKQWLQNNPTTVIYQLATPVYEPIDYNPLEVYSEVTHITTNSTIPCNVIVKNHGYNMVALKENTQYTLYVNKDTTNTLTYRLGDYIEVTAPSKFTFTTPATLTDKTLRIDGKGAKVNDLMLIEGTPTNDSIGYFDGLKSSYECEQVTDENDENYGKYKVDIKVVGKNLFHMGKIVLNKYQNSNSSTGNYSIVDNPSYKVSGFIRVKPNTNYFKTKGNIGVYYSLDKTPIKGTRIERGSKFTTPYNCHYVVFTFNIEEDISNWQLEEGDTATEYEPYFESKQTIYLNSPLLKGDEIVWKDNKIQHYHKMYKVVLDGSDDEGWNLNKNYSTGGQYVSYESVRDVKPKSDLTIYCDKIKYIGAYDGVNDCIWVYNNLSLVIQNSTIETLEDFRQWLQANPVTVVYELETPYYEEISDYPLKLNVIANSSLSTESTIQVTNISFNIYEETLPYLYPNTKYYITFNADVDRNNIIINLGGNHVVFDCKVGFNKVEITTPSDTTNLLTFSGTGVNIDHVKVTQQDIDEYFEGMKSVGECEENKIEIASQNNLANIATSGDTNFQVANIRAGVTYSMKCTRSDNTVRYNLRLNDGYGVKLINGTLGDFCTFTPPTNGILYFNAHGSNTITDIMLVEGIYTEDTMPQFKPYTENKKQLAHEPLRAVGDYRDRYVLIDGKWYIERKYGKAVLDGSVVSGNVSSYFPSDNSSIFFIKKEDAKSYDNWLACDKFMPNINVSNSENRNVEGIFTSVNGSITAFYFRIFNNKLSTQDINGCKQYLQQNPVTVVYQLATPIYEPIDYNPFETYADITHISTNSLIPTNVVVKNHGYNCILKPSTKYTIALNKPNGTISAKLGGSAKVDSTNSIFTITTPSTLNDNVLRLSGSGNVKDIMILEGDKTVNTPSYFEGIESGFEQEYDVEKGKYRVTARAEGNGKESSIIFYLNEPLRGTGIAKDRVFIQDGKVVVQRNCSSITLDGSENIHKANTDFDSVNNISFSIDIDNIASSWTNCNNIVCSTLPNVGNRTWKGNMEGITSNDIIILFCISRNKLQTQDVNGFKQWLQANPTKVVYVLAEPVYEEADCDLSKLVLENYENSSLIFESNIPVSANIRYSGEVPVVTQAKSLSSQVDNTTLDINENIIPYMCDIDYRIVELQLMNGDTQGEGIELLGIGDIEILGNENVLFNNREDKKHNFSYDMLKRDILSQRYSKEEYRYRLDRYLLANKISDEEYKELEGLLNNGK